MKKFTILKIYVNSQFAVIFNRKDMLNACDPGYKTGIENVFDHYRKALELGGYIERVSRGNYRLVKGIPAELTLTELRKQVYPNTYGKKK